MSRLGIGAPQPGSEALFIHTFVEPPRLRKILMKTTTTTTSLRCHVYATAFHGGGLISSHRVAERALARSVREKIGDCTCGCAVVVAEMESDIGTYIGDDGYVIQSCVDELAGASSASSPYSPAL